MSIRSLLSGSGLGGGGTGRLGGRGASRLGGGGVGGLAAGGGSVVLHHKESRSNLGQTSH